MRIKPFIDCSYGLIQGNKKDDGILRAQMLADIQQGTIPIHTIINHTALQLSIYLCNGNVSVAVQEDKFSEAKRQVMVWFECMYKLLPNALVDQ